MKVSMNLTTSDFGPRGRGNSLPVFAQVDEEKNVTEINTNHDHLTGRGTTYKVWISKNQFKKLSKAPNTPLTGKLIDSVSIRIYEH